jgi:hypothetical protein
MRNSSREVVAGLAFPQVEEELIGEGEGEEEKKEEAKDWQEVQKKVSNML